MPTTKKKSTKKKTSKKRSTKNVITKAQEPKVEKKQETINLTCLHCTKEIEVNRSGIRVIKEIRGSYTVGSEVYSKLTWYVCLCPKCQNKTAGQIREK